MACSCIWAPSIEQVAALVRARTRGVESRDASVAGEQGTFTDTTRPTAEQVEELIDMACGELQALFAGRSPCSASLKQSAGVAASYRAAQLVEVSYFPEQTNADQTAFSSLQKMWEEAGKNIAAAVRERCPIDPVDGGQDDGGALTPVGVVPSERLISRSWPGF